MSLSYEKTLKEWRTHEKDTRQSFLTSCGDHFLIRLFSSAAEKPGPPRVSVCVAASCQWSESGGGSGSLHPHSVAAVGAGSG